MWKSFQPYSSAGRGRLPSLPGPGGLTVPLSLSLFAAASKAEAEKDGIRETGRGAMIGLVGCRFCGVVTREDSLEDGVGACAECGRSMESISLGEARAMVAARRRGETRRGEGAKAVCDLGLQEAGEL